MSLFKKKPKFKPDSRGINKKTKAQKEEMCPRWTGQSQEESALSLGPRPNHERLGQAGYVEKGIMLGAWMLWV